MLITNKQIYISALNKIFSIEMKQITYDPIIENIAIDSFGLDLHFYLYKIGLPNKINFHNLYFGYTFHFNFIDDTILRLLLSSDKYKIMLGLNLLINI
jgi:hypothetical protein